jgi:GDP-L-fucose synthase
MKKLLVTGGNGLVGSELNCDIKVGREFDLRNPFESDNLIIKYQPTQLIHCAGKVAGLGGNINYMGEYFYDNLMINTNIIESCRKYNVQKLLVFSSTCVFPEMSEYPLTEDKIHLGHPHKTNYGYAYAKRMCDVQISAYNEQYGTRYFSIIPCNMYGPNDNYNIENSHVIPSLIHKVYLANKNNTNVSVWGSGKSLREFIFSKDVARISEILIENYEETKPIIVSPSNETSIEEIITTICDILKFKNKIVFDTSKPEGQFKKPSDNSYLKSIIGDYNFTPIRDGLEETIEYFIKNYNTLRK